jgi:hypothetical protein
VTFPVLHLHGGPAIELSPDFRTLWKILFNGNIYTLIRIRTATSEATVEDHSAIGLGWVLIRTRDNHRMPWRNIDGVQDLFWAFSISVSESFELSLKSGHIFCEIRTWCQLNISHSLTPEFCFLVSLYCWCKRQKYTKTELHPRRFFFSWKSWFTRIRRVTVTRMSIMATKFDRNRLIWSFLCLIVVINEQII